jgi:adenylate cyclase
VARFNTFEKENDRELPTRIGIHAGFLSLGNVGHDLYHLEYRPLGDVVNTAQRLEALNKRLGTRILVSEEVLGQLAGFIFRPLGRFTLAGKEQPVAVCELIGRTTDVEPHKLQLCQQFERALATFHTRAFDEAADLFQQLSANGESDDPALFFFRKCQDYLAKPPPADWDGTVDLKKK